MIKIPKNTILDLLTADSAAALLAFGKQILDRTVLGTDLIKAISIHS